MVSFKPVRGTRDILPDECRRLRHIEQVACDLAARYGFDEVSTPIFEETTVFARSLGDTSDIVSKEMYSFESRGGTSLTLRPENTAGVVRAVLDNGLVQQSVVKLFYRGPMFRYERPQKGRYRQFHQIGVELLGSNEPSADVDVITLGADILKELGLQDHVMLELNSLGDIESRAAYRQVLVDYLSDHRDRLSPDSVERLERNPLRVLDSKDEGDQAVVADAPSLLEALNAQSRAHFDAVQDGLTAVGVAFRINPRLVRGLDYYCHTAFEFTTTTLGAQNAVMAGGRYDGLSEQLGGPAVAGIGWAAGVERLSLMIADAPSRSAPIVVAPVEAAQQQAAQVLAHRLRGAGFTVELGYSGALGKRLKRANKLGAKAAVIMGDAELARDAVIVRDMETGAQDEVTLSALIDHLGPWR